MESARKSHAISVARTLPIDGALVHDILLRLRRDSAGTPLRWTLGDRGIVEIDVNFSSVTAGMPSWTASARVWDNRGLSLVGVSLRIKATADTVTLALVPSSALPPWWETRVPELLDLTHAAVDELAEELLWHASRV